MRTSLYPQFIQENFPLRDWTRTTQRVLPLSMSHKYFETNFNKSSVDGSIRRTPATTTRSKLSSVLGPQLMENLYWTLSTGKTHPEKKSLSSGQRSSMSRCTKSANSTLLKYSVICKGVLQKWEAQLLQVPTRGTPPLTKVLPTIRVSLVLQTLWTLLVAQLAILWLWARTIPLSNNFPREIPPKYLLPSSSLLEYLTWSKSFQSPHRTSSTVLLILNSPSKFLQGRINFYRPILTLPQSTSHIAMCTSGWLKLKKSLATLSALMICGYSTWNLLCESSLSITLSNSPYS